MIHFDIAALDAPPRLIVTERMPYPIDKVWLVHTEALYLKEWWAPKGYENTWAEIDPKVGGTWRVVQRDPEGNSFSFYGHFDEVVRPRRLVQTRTSEFFPEAPTQVTTEFTEIPGGTQIVTTVVFASDVYLQGYLNLGGVERIRGASERLGALLSEM